MRIPSRRMPKYVRPPRRWYAWPIAAVFFGLPVYLLGTFIVSAPAVAPPLLALGVAMVMFLAKREQRRVRALIADRHGESICEFARSFDRRRVDTWVIRAVYEELQSVLRTERPLPIRAQDSLEHDLRVDDEDLDELVWNEIAQRTARSMDQTERNPYFGKVKTVADLVHFVNGQPKRAL